MSKPRFLLTVLGPFIGLALVIGFFSCLPDVRPYFLTGPNFKVIFIQTVIVAIGALGMTMIIISGGIDLSVGSVIALTSVVGAMLLLNKFPPLLAALARHSRRRFRRRGQRRDDRRFSHDALHRHARHDGHRPRRGQVARQKPGPHRTARRSLTPSWPPAIPIIFSRCRPESGSRLVSRA